MKSIILKLCLIIATLGFSTSLQAQQINPNKDIKWPSTFGVLSNDGSGNVAFIPPFAVDITQPPYNAKCDGTTDDHVAIQAALDNNANIMIPTGPEGPTECMLGTVGITLCSASNVFGYNAIYGNGQILGYSGSGNAITVSSACNTILPNIGYSRILDLNIDAGKATGTPNMIEGLDASLMVIDNVNDGLYTTLPAGSYNSILLFNAIGTETGEISNYSGNGSLVIVGGSSGTCCLTISSSIFDSFQSVGTADVTLNGVSFSSTSDPSTINDALQFSIISTDFAGPLQIGSLDGGTSWITSTSSAFDTVTATGQTFFSGTTNNFPNLTSLPVITGAYSGTISGGYKASGIEFNEKDGLELAPFYYSVAGTALPTCNSGLSGTQLQVSDATLPTFLGTYVGGGAVKAAVLCNGTNWVTY